MTERDEWLEHDDFWRVWESYIFDAPRLEAATTEAEQLTCLLGPDPPAQVLDLCCGPARHAIALARRRFIVTGVD